MIAVALQTCDRFDYTRRTLETFAEHNDLARFTLLHADDASENDDVIDLAHQFGFRTCYRSETREGISRVRTKLVEKAAHSCEWVLLLENDIASLRPFPWALFDAVRNRPDIYCLRLFGKYKDVERKDPCLEIDKWTRSLVRWVRWKDAPERAEIGRVHWTAQPAVTRSHDAAVLLKKARRPDRYTVRVTRNVMAHIGEERTPGRVL